MNYFPVNFVKCLFANIQNQKVAFFLRNRQGLRVNNSIILRVENAKFWGYYCYVNYNIKGNFQTCISIPLIHKHKYAYLTTNKSEKWTKFKEKTSLTVQCNVGLILSNEFKKADLSFLYILFWCFWAQT